MIEFESPTEKDIVTGLKLENLWHSTQSLGLPLALWKLPRMKEIKLLISGNRTVTNRQPDLEALPPGFMISPFQSEVAGQALFMEGDILYTFSPDNELITSDTFSPTGDQIQKKLINLSNFEAKPSKTESLTFTPLIPHPGDSIDDQSHFKTIVAKALQAIKTNEFDKVVLSRRRELAYNEQFNPILAFTKLCHAYTDAFVSMVYLAETDELWLGATPEILAEMNSKGIFKTVSLAGTQRAYAENGDFIKQEEVRWTQKEIEEQALVSRYIVECFKKIRLREYVERGPKTSLAGNLYHLRTDFEVDTHEHNFPELGTVMLDLLHPTSAVCGVPKEPALQFLMDNEGYDRSLYSGYLGPVNVDGASNLFVNLRTMRLLKGKATVYAGAGITEDSDPQKEWEETELKCQTLLRVFQHIAD
jgi:isochorismate synthase